MTKDCPKKDIKALEVNEESEKRRPLRKVSSLGVKPEINLSLFMGGTGFRPGSFCSFTSHVSKTQSLA
jgi:hypothetical protein